MPMVPLQANLSTDDLVLAVDQLSTSELDEFVGRILKLRARRRVRSLSAEETTLLQRINQGLSHELQDRYQILIARRDTRTLTPEEHKELLRITDQVEQSEADRGAALLELAQLREVSVDQVLRELGIGHAYHG
jgi:hypothetical protein